MQSNTKFSVSDARSSAVRRLPITLNSCQFQPTEKRQISTVSIDTPPTPLLRLERGRAITETANRWAVQIDPLHSTTILAKYYPNNFNTGLVDVMCR